MTKDNKNSKICPACQSTFVTETLYGWICADCGATKEKPSSKSKLLG